MQEAMFSLETNDLVCFEVWRNVFIVQDKNRPLGSQVGRKVRQRVYQRGARFVQDSHGSET